MFLLFLTTAQVVTADGTCDHSFKFPEATPDFYAVQIYPERSYRLFQKVEKNIYQSEDGDRLVESDRTEEWKICIKNPHNTHCEDAFIQPGKSPVPVGGTHWKDVNTGNNINIEIQALDKCQEIRGFKIETTEEQFTSYHFQNCKSYGDSTAASFISYSKTDTGCSYSFEPFVKIVSDVHSALLIFESHGLETTPDETATISSTAAITITTADNPFLNKTESLKEEKEHPTILYICICLLVLLLFLIFSLIIYIYKKRTKITTETTTNESYGNFSDYAEYYKDKKNNTITDRNEYYKIEN